MNRRGADRCGGAPHCGVRFIQHICLVEGATAAGDTLGHVAHAGAEHVDGSVVIHGLLPLLEALVGDGAADESLDVLLVDEEGLLAIHDHLLVAVGLLVAGSAVSVAVGAVDVSGLLGSDIVSLAGLLLEELDGAAVESGSDLVLTLTEEGVSYGLGLISGLGSLGGGLIVAILDGGVDGLELLLDLSVSGISLKGILEGTEGLVEAAELLKSDTLAEVTLQPVGADTDAAISVEEGLVELVKGCEAGGTVGVQGASLGARGIDVDGLGVVGDGLSVVLDLEGGVALSLEVSDRHPTSVML